jgi:uncharacterized membrane protein YfcA
VGLAGWIASLAVGLVAGVLSGLVGVGGGVVMVPFLYALFSHPQGFGVVGPTERQAVLAHATSLFVIVPTAVRGTWLYHRARLVEWRAVAEVGGGSVVAAAAVAAVADRAPDAALRLAFACFLLVTAWRVAAGEVGAGPARSAGARRAWRGVAGGLAVGALSALLGVGGGIVAIPVLLYVLRVDVKKVAATSLAVVALTALAGSLTYALAGAGGAPLPRGAVGYVYLPAAAGLAAGTLVSVGWGTALNRRWSARRLRRVFAWVLAAMGVVIGVESGLELGGG